MKPTIPMHPHEEERVAWVEEDAKSVFPFQLWVFPGVLLLSVLTMLLLLLMICFVLVVVVVVVWPAWMHDCLLLS